MVPFFFYIVSLCLACSVDVYCVNVFCQINRATKLFHVDYYYVDIYDRVCLLCENDVAMRLFISWSPSAEVKGANELSVVMSYYPQIPVLSLVSPQWSQEEKESEIHVPLSSTLINKHVILILVCFHGNPLQSQDWAGEMRQVDKNRASVCFSSIRVIGLL